MTGGKSRCRVSRRLALEPLEERALLTCSVHPNYVVFDATTRAGISATDLFQAATSVAPLDASSPTGLTPAQIRGAYGINSIAVGSVKGDGAGQTIAIVDAYDDPALLGSSDPNFLTSDLHRFDAQFGLADPPSFRKVGQDGSTHLAPASGTSGWSMEESLDVEWAHAVAPGAAIVLVEANDASIASMMAAVNTARNLQGVSVVSMSFGTNEFTGETGYDSYFTTPAGHAGVTFVASTGDGGSPGGYPAYSGNVLAVGGTTLRVSGNSYAGEACWALSGGGPSTQEAEPAAQGTVQVSGWREAPDVAFDADPDSGVAVYDSYDCGAKTPWVQVGGTSLSAPCWGGLISIANQLRSVAGRPSLDGASLTMAKIYSLPAGDFHDITGGSYSVFPPGLGYDMITGRGSPVANLLVPDLAGLPSSQGVVALAARQYLVGSTATITLRDGDLSANHTCSVTVTSSLGDSENVTLTALGDGFFQGTIATSGNSSIVRGDGVLQTTDGITAIGVTYNDANDGTGNAAVAAATAAAYFPLTIVTSSPTSPITPNQSYRLAVAAFGGVGAYSWSYAGSLPAGLSLNGTTGVISGTPTVAGKYHLVVTVADAGSPQNTFSVPLDFTVGTLITAVSTTAGGGTCHVAGDSIPLTVSFGQAVTVIGTPQILLNAGSGATAYYVSGSGTSSLVFNYTIGSGQYAFDLDYASTAALSVAGGSIRDSAGNAVSLTLPPTGVDGLAASKIIIGPLPTTGSLTAVATSGNKATLTARFLTNPATSITPTGTVQFIDATTQAVLGQATLAGGAATLTTATLSGGTHAFVAQYLGNAEFQAAASVPVVSAASTITTLVGSGSLDGAPATAVCLSDLASAVADAAGNIYLADTSHNRIRRVDHITGIITTVVGTGAWGDSGDGGQATAAKIAYPTGIALDANGNLYFAESGAIDGTTWTSGGGRVRKVNLATGIITTVAGSAVLGYSGDGGQATAAEMSGPMGIALDSAGNLFIADKRDQCVRRVDHATGIITTVAGNGTAGYSGDGGQATAANLSCPEYVAVDSAGNLFIADSGNNCIRQVNHASGVITTIAGTGAAGYSGDSGQATAAALKNPLGIVLDAAGNLLIADSGNNCIRQVSHASGIITTIAGTGTAGYSGNGGQAAAALLNAPAAVSLDAAGNLLICDAGNHVVREVSHAAGTIATLAGNGFANYGGDGGTAANAVLNDAMAVAVDASGNIFIADSQNDCIREVNHATGIITTVAGTGILGESGDGGLATNARIFNPVSVAVDNQGNLYFGEPDYLINQSWVPGGCRVRKVNLSTGIITTVAGTGNWGYSGDGGQATNAKLTRPLGLAVDSAGNLFIADGYDQCVREVNMATGVITTVAGNGTAGYTGNGGQATAAELHWPRSIRVDSLGNLFIADGGNNCVREVNHATGVITTIAGNGTAGYTGDGGQATAAELSDVYGLTLDSAGNLFIADAGNACVREVNLSTGLIATVAGNTQSGSSGDGGPAGSAKIWFPTDVGMDSNGNLLIVDEFSSAIRMVAATPPQVTLSLATPTVTVRDAGGTYNGAAFAATATVAGAGGSAAASLEGVSPTLTYYVGNKVSGSGSATAPSAAGTYTVVASFAGSADYTAAQSGPVTFTVGKATPTISVSDAGGAYKGSAFTATATVAGAGGTAAASLEGVSPTLTYYAGNKASGTGSATAPGAAGTYTVVASFAGSADYNAAQSGPVTFTVGKATPTVNASDGGGTYKGSAFAATATVAGISRTAAASLEGVSPTLTYYAGNKASGTGSAVAPSAAGTYTVVASFAGSADYCSASSQTTFTISRATLTVSGITASNKTYDGTTAAQLNLSSAKLSGAVKGDVVTLAANGAVGTFAVKNAGTNTVQVAGLSLSGAKASNYVIAPVTTTASITPRNLTISALNASKTYGNADPAFSVSYAGFAAGEGAGVLGGHVTFKTNEGGATSAAPGRYAITPSGLTATNYAISFANGTLTIGKAQSAITVKMSGSSTSYGLTSVTFTAAVAPIAPGAGVPSGTVTFMDASTNRVLGRATLSKGAVSCTLQFGTSTHAITASYSGDVDFTASTATVVTSNTKSAAGVRATDRSYGLSGLAADAALLSLTATPTALCQH